MHLTPALLCGGIVKSSAACDTYDHINVSYTFVS